MSSVMFGAVPRAGALQVRMTAGTLNEVLLGALAQLEEHLLCKQRVRGSSPLSSTHQKTAASGDN